MKKIRTLFLIYSIFTCLLFADEFTFSGDRMQTVLAKGKERTILTGNAQLLSEDNFIQADFIELYGEDFTYALCEGNVKIINTKKGIEVTCQKLFYDRSLKISRIQGNAVMLDNKNELVVKGGFIENRDNPEISIIQIGVRILKEDMVCRAETARYLREEDKLELSGMPIVHWKGDEYQAAKIYVDLDKDEIKLEGDVKGEVISEEKEDEEITEGTSTETDMETESTTDINEEETIPGEL